MFSNLKIRTRLIASFLAITLLLGLVCLSSYIGLHKLLDSLTAYSETRESGAQAERNFSAETLADLFEETRDRAEMSMKWLAGVTVFALVLTLTLGLLVSRSITRPITLLQKAAEIIGKGCLDYRIPIQSADELGRLADSFNATTLKLKESYANLESIVENKTKELEEKIHEIKKAHAKNEAILASIGDGMVVIDQDERITIMNKPAEAMLGWKAEEAMGKLFTQIVPAEDDKGYALAHQTRPMRMALTLGKKLSSTAYYFRKDKSKFPVAITVSPINLGGSTIGAIEIFRDITKEKEQDTMKTEFIQVVSHELRTPLTTIREGVSQVTDGILGQTTPEQREFLAIALEDIDRLRRIIDNLLDISKIEAGKFELRKERLDIARLADGVCCTFAARAKSQGLILKRPDAAKPIYVYGDKDKLIQVFTNLIGNALKFTEQGHVEISFSGGESRVECAVSDTGKGIAPEDLPNVFGKFEQFGREHGAGEKGTGLGLSIVKGIIELHGGTIRAESKPGKGARFSFELPTYTPEEAFIDRINPDLKNAVKSGMPISVLQFAPVNGGESETASGERGKIEAIMKNLETVIKGHLKRPADKTLRFDDAVFALLSETNKYEAVIEAENILRDSCQALANGSASSSLKIFYKLSGYPDDGLTGQAVLAALRKCRPVTKSKW